MNLHFCHCPNIIMLAVVFMCSVTLADDPTHDAFTYQGQLKHNGEPVSEPVDLTFRLYSEAVGGNQIGVELVADAFDAFDEEGRFTIDLAFGKGVFTGIALWLEIEVDEVILTPRQPIMPTPYAVRALTVSPAAVPFMWNGANDAVFGGGNVGIGVSSPLASLHVAEGTSGTGLILPGLRVFQNVDSPNVIGGFSGNEVGPSVFGATIGGGGREFSDQINRVLGHFGTVGGGALNTAGGIGSYVGGGQNNAASEGHSTVSGGFSNTASGSHCTVAGGVSNIAVGNGSAVGGGGHNSADESGSVVAGGWTNIASGFMSAVGGGEFNGTGGSHSTVPGGMLNSAAGDFSLAAGRRAKANHHGAFVWGDSTIANIESTGDNQFLIRATGGVYLTTGDGSAPFLSSMGDQPLELRVNNQRALRIELSSASPNIIGGFEGNEVGLDVVGATISGGGSAGLPPFTDHSNSVLAHFGTVGGGAINTAGGHSSTVGGGWFNEAIGESSTVPGGRGNTAAGNFSFAAGRQAKANHPGSFVWSDSNGNDLLIAPPFASTAIDQFLVRAAGGIGLGTNAPRGQVSIGDHLDFYSGGLQSPTRPSIRGSSSDNLILSAVNNGDVYLNHDGGSGGVRFHDGTTSGVLMRLTPDGALGIGPLNPIFQLQLSLDSAAKPTSNTWTVFSDARLKKNIHTIDHALDDLLALRGVTYQWRDPGTQGNMAGTYTGFIAQEVEEVFPEWIAEGANGYKTLTVIGFEGLVVEALRELRDEKDAELVQLRSEHDAALAAVQRHNERLQQELDDLRRLVDQLIHSDRGESR